MSTEHLTASSSGRPQPELRYHFSAILFALITSKAVVLAPQLSPEHRFAFVPQLLSGDLFVLGIVVLLDAIRSQTCHTIGGCISATAAALLTVWFAADLKMILNIDARVTIEELIKYASMWRKAVEYHVVGLREFMLSAAAVFFLTRRLRGSVFRAKHLAGIGAALTAFSLIAPAQDATASKYAFDSKFILEASHPFHDISRYTPAEVAHYSSLAPPHPPAVPKNSKNIILVVIESLSSADSKAISGLNNHLKRFDRMANDGILFTQFYANHWNTEGGMVAILNGMPVIQYPGGGNVPYIAFGKTSSVLKEYVALGYKTAVVRPFYLTFFNIGDYLQRVGFETVLGPENDERLKAHPGERTPWCCSADRRTYDVAMTEARKLRGSGSPYLLYVETLSSHRPWVDPTGTDDSEERVWDYVDTELERFYHLLREERFLEDTLLVITGDHHKMIPVTEQEWKRYGPTAPSRIPLLMLGAGVTPRRDDRPFQQADLLRKLADAIEPQGELTKWVTVGVQVVGVRGASGGYSIIDPRKPFERTRKFTVDGSEIVWALPPPDEFGPLEEEMHRQRALNQQTASTAPKLCNFEPHLGVGPKSAPGAPRTPGVWLESYNGSKINGMLGPASPRLRRTASLESFDVVLEEMRPDFQKVYSLRYLTSIAIPESGRYKFKLFTADGVCLVVNSELVIDANSRRPELDEFGSKYLERGEAKVELRYFDKDSISALKLEWQRPGGNKWEPIPPEFLSYDRSEYVPATTPVEAAPIAN